MGAYDTAFKRFKVEISELKSLGLKINSFIFKRLPGDGETFYLHCLFNYLVPFAIKTLEDFNCGLGIWTMQGVEHMNKLSEKPFDLMSTGRGIQYPNRSRKCTATSLFQNKN